jgi:hypothetical protein
MTWLLIYLTTNSIVSATIIAWNYKEDPEEVKAWLEEVYSDMPMSDFWTTVYLVISMTLFTIPVLIHNYIKGEE